MKTLAVAAMVALLSCTTSSPQSASAPRLSTPSSTVVNVADSLAVDFRTRLDLLLGEHVFAVAKESSAAGRGGEYTGYLHLLISNGTDLTELVRSAFGDTAATRFGQIWSAQNIHLVDYDIGLVTRNKSMAEGSMSSLVKTFVPQLSQFLNARAQIPLASIEQLVFQHVLETKAMIDDQFSQSYPRLYADIRIVYAQASLIGDALAPRIAQRFPDKFPGVPSSPAADLRVSLNNLLQEHLYLATMATSAATEGRETEEPAAAHALAENAAALDTLFGDLFGASAATQFGQIWAARDSALIGNASASTAPAIQSTLSRLNDVFVPQFSGFLQSSTGLAPDISRAPIQAQVLATIAVINDQRSRSLAMLATDDRAAGVLIEVVAELIAGAAIARLHSRFAGAEPVSPNPPPWRGNGDSARS